MQTRSPISEEFEKPSNGPLDEPLDEPLEKPHDMLGNSYTLFGPRQNFELDPSTWLYLKEKNNENIETLEQESEPFSEPTSDQIPDRGLDAKTSDTKSTELDLVGYHGLPMNERSVIDGIISDVAETMSMYKSLSYMYPNWLDVDTRNHKHPEKSDYSEYNIEITHRLMSLLQTPPNLQSHLPHHSTHNIHRYDRHVHNSVANVSSDEVMRDTGMFLMTRVLDSQYTDIANYRKSSNNPMHRALWHIARVVNFREIVEKARTTNDRESMYCSRIAGKFFRLLDVFCLLSRPKTVTEFTESYRSIYRKIMSVDPESKGETVPLWVYHKYSGLSVPNIYKVVPSLSTISLLQKIGARDVFVLLTRKFQRPIVQLDTVRKLGTVTRLEKKEEKHDLLPLVRSMPSLPTSTSFTLSTLQEGSKNDEKTVNVRTVLLNEDRKRQTDPNDGQFDGSKHGRSEQHKNTSEMLQARKYGKRGYLLSDKTHMSDTNRNWRNRESRTKASASKS
ncbi:hypothetical protein YASMINEVIRUS_371 [Yasminevirus sp. GU-2018]|uniref:Uncharacterized protein n=1 Tax=Yasminevirus sp. GU-2018 TaxID=2420051 RepID=A0A5K0U7I0_9VIRU|nr:hypothetical protein YASMINEVIRUS_371 [Yasminevirus sp. GU-2018]